jgi:uncharacterized delta-60 repeat protein
MLVLGLLASLATAAKAAPGDLDPTFGDGGLVRSGFWAHANGLALADNGFIVAGQVGGSGNGGAFSLIRYTNQGEVVGIASARLDDTSTSGEAYDVAVQPDGKLVAIGWMETCPQPPHYYLENGCSRHHVVARFNGALDSGFGNGGIVTLMTLEPRAVAIQPDGKIVVVGTRPYGGFALARYLDDGGLDPSFGDGGIATSSTWHGWSSASSVLIQPDGMIVVGGEGDSGPYTSARDFAVARFHPNGAPDPAFGTGGMVTTDFGASEGVTDIAIQSIDSEVRIVAVGESGSYGDRDFAIARYRARGALDTSFAGSGKVITDLGGDETASSAGIDAYGRVIVAGATCATAGFSCLDFALARYNRDGTVDTTFGAAGTTTTDFGGREGINDLAIQPADGRILAAGRMTLTYDWEAEVALARYDVTGQPVMVPRAPSLSAASGYETVHLQWTTPYQGASPITGYRIYRRTDSRAEKLLRQVGIVSSFDDDTVANGTRYFYRVSAVNASGEGALSKEVAVTPPAIPGAPSLSWEKEDLGTQAGYPRIVLKWTVPSRGGSPIYAYRIRRSSLCQSSETIVDVSGDTTKYTDTSSTHNGCTYYYMVRAVNAEGEGLPSNEVEVHRTW